MYFSIVIPIHNEAKFLPYSLPSIYQIEPDEVILIFDRCTDDSLKIAKKIASNFCYISRNKFIEFNKETPKWNRRAAFLYRYGYRIARNDIILTVDADIILDKCVKFYLNMIGKYGIHLISFSWIPFHLTDKFTPARDELRLCINFVRSITLWEKTLYQCCIIKSLKDFDNNPCVGKWLRETEWTVENDGFVDILDNFREPLPGEALRTSLFLITGGRLQKDRN